MKTKLRFLKWLMVLMISVCTFGALAQNQNLTQTVCVSSQPYYVDESLILGATYNWSISGGGTITSGAGTRSITIDWTTPGGPYTVSVYTSANGCDGTPQSLAVTVVSQPIGPTLNVKTPDLASVCDGTNVSATFIAGSGGVGCSDAFEYRFDGGTWTAYTPGANLSTTGHTSVEIQGQRSGCTSGAGCTGTSWVTLASWAVAPIPTATISYEGSPFCFSLATPQAVTLTGTTGGTYTALPVGLTIDASTGAITPSTSTVGDYTVTYTIAAAGGCSEVTATSSVTITTAPIATIFYAGSPYCTSVTTPQSVTRTGTTGGTYTAPIGLTIDASTGAITPSTSTAGTYTVTYTIPASGGCATLTATTSVTITTAPAATISYAGSPFCNSVVTPQAVTLTGTTGGTYTSTVGLTIDGSTGAITPSTSTAGTYTVTYTIAAAGGCAEVTATASVTITTAPAATISYTGTPFCTSVATPQAVIQTGTAGGTYTAPIGLTIDAITGAITPSTSTADTYTVTYTIAAAGGCAEVTATASVTITTAPAATISYEGSPFCFSLATPQAVTHTGTTGGTYSSSAGLTIDGATGAITPSTSTVGDYTVTYTIAAAGGCTEVTATASVTITTAPIATISYEGSPFCFSLATPQAVTRTGTTGGTFSSTAGLTIDAATGAITPSTSTVGDYTVTYTIAAAGGCAEVTATATVTITTAPAATISYAGTPYCTSIATPQPVTRTGTTGGTYSSTVGLTIDAATGAITPSTSTAGTYTVTYTIAASEGCAEVTATALVTITTAPAATISYAGAPFCNDITTPQPVTLTGTAGGTYSSTAGLTIDVATGAITPNTSTAGTYTVTYTIAAAGGCVQVTATTSVTINVTPTTSKIWHN